MAFWKKLISYRKKIIKISIIFFVIILCIPLPKDPFSYSRVLYSIEGKLLSACTSKEQQWRLPTDSIIPSSLIKSIILYEDEYFYYHLGINPISIINAAYVNIRKGKIVRGASTIPMQVMRMRNRSKNRGIWMKLYESFSAIKYSMTHRKSMIIHDWATIAPFGGNTIGAHAASWRYFGRDLNHLSWAEYALLAVMPNSPTKANISKNKLILKNKRDRLLKKMFEHGYFKESDLVIYHGEDLPQDLFDIPQHAYHFLEFVSKQNPKQFIFRSTLHYHHQLMIENMIEEESKFMKLNDIKNMSAVVVDNITNQLMAYVGNTKNVNEKYSYVDVVQAPRSYGSLLKPFLYLFGLENRNYFPYQLIEDIPTVIGEYQPQNFDKLYRGAVPLDDIIVQSLNVPSVRMLQDCGLPAFYDFLEKLEIKHLNKGAEHYGLTLILGGGESSLWEMTRLYKGLAQNHMGISHPYGRIKYLLSQKITPLKHDVQYSPINVDYTLASMSNITRPREEKSWFSYDGSHKIAWKTGTSFGHRDAWAIGCNAKYTVGIWVGNENGEGRSELTGVSKAAPIMFKLFNVLPNNQWFANIPNRSKYESITVCIQSGKMASNLCQHTKSINIVKSSLQYQQCSHHKVVNLNNKGEVISLECPSEIARTDTIFLLPPHIEYYYKPGHSEYLGFGKIDINCQSKEMAELKLIYPQEGVQIFLPKTPDKKNEMIAKAYSNQKGEPLFWFLDGKYKTTTTGNHDYSFMIGIGNHELMITSPSGMEDRVKFTILSK